jgi:hypothetical protein
MRLHGVPRATATRLTSTMSDVLGQSLTSVRTRLRSMDESNWKQTLGQHEGGVYQKVWRIPEGLEYPE